ncbi:hypothetical protein [Cereibacter sphaeroides]|uniref:hypothetical protein n=1 Tax=Cereibacter sphaeroides TaxID=1063 RepID=UPI00313CEB86
MCPRLGCPVSARLNRRWAQKVRGESDRWPRQRNDCRALASPAADRLNAAYARHLATLGEPSERLDAQAMAELTGSRHYLSGLFTTDR